RSRNDGCRTTPVVVAVLVRDPLIRRYGKVAPIDRLYRWLTWTGLPPLIELPLDLPLTSNAAAQADIPLNDPRERSPTDLLLPFKYYCVWTFLHPPSSPTTCEPDQGGSGKWHSRIAEFQWLRNFDDLSVGHLKFVPAR